MIHRIHALVLVYLAAAISLGSTGTALSANWSVNRVNHMLLTPPGGVTVQEMSGVTYVGPAAGGLHRFIAVQQKNPLVQFDLSIDATGAVTGISNVTSIPISLALDFEGIAYTNSMRNSVFISDEDGPGIREFNLAGGALLQNLPIPAVFAHRVGNRGFESLTRSPDATVMWTANEEAITVDGPTSSPANGTTVRLLRLNVAGNTVTAAQQYAYNVEPLHGAVFSGARSGLSDLTYMPDGTLLALERSAAIISPPFLNRIYEINSAGATDVSVGAPAAGLIGQTYTPVAKQLLWSGAADGGAGQNLEGLALGPRLANGSFVLIGVVDDDPTDSDTLSANTIVAFTATANPSADFDGDGDVDGADLLLLQRGFGKTIGAQHSEGDADRDGDVDNADLNRWKTHFGGAPSATNSSPAPEPTSAFHSLVGLAALIRRARKPREMKSKSG